MTTPIRMASDVGVISVPGFALPIYYYLAPEVAYQTGEYQGGGQVRIPVGETGRFVIHSAGILGARAEPAQGIAREVIEAIHADMRKRAIPIGEQP